MPDTTTPPVADQALDDLLSAIAADPDAGAWGDWAERLLSDGEAPAERGRLATAK